MDEMRGLPPHLQFLTSIVWRVSEIDGITALEGSTPTLEFSPEGRISGSSGLNRVVGSWSFRHDRLIIPPLASTEMAGEPEAMDQEARLFEILNGVLGLEIVLRSPTGALRIVPGASASGSPKQRLVTGTVTYRERIALVPGCTVSVQVADVSSADAQAVVLGEQVQTSVGNLPIPYRIELDSKVIDERHTYVVRATITSSEGHPLWSTDRVHHVLTGGAADTADLILVGVSQPRS